MACCNNFYTNCRSRRQSSLGAISIMGPTGTTETTNENATIFNDSVIDITSGTPLVLQNTLTNNQLTIAGNSITVTTDGTYLVSYGTNFATSASGTDNVAIAIDGVINTATEKRLSATSSTSGTYVLDLQANNSLSIVPTVTSTTQIEATGGPSAYLTIVKIG